MIANEQVDCWIVFTVLLVTILVLLATISRLTSRGRQFCNPGIPLILMGGSANALTTCDLIFGEILLVFLTGVAVVTLLVMKKRGWALALVLTRTVDSVSASPFITSEGYDYYPLIAATGTMACLCYLCWQKRISALGDRHFSQHSIYIITGTEPRFVDVTQSERDNIMEQYPNWHSGLSNLTQTRNENSVYVGLVNNVRPVDLAKNNYVIVADPTLLLIEKLKPFFSTIYVRFIPSQYIQDDTVVTIIPDEAYTQDKTIKRSHEKEPSCNLFLGVTYTYGVRMFKISGAPKTRKASSTRMNDKKRILNADAPDFKPGSSLSSQSGSNTDNSINSSSDSENEHQPTTLKAQLSNLSVRLEGAIQNQANLTDIRESTKLAAAEERIHHLQDEITRLLQHTTKSFSDHGNLSVARNGQHATLVSIDHLVQNLQHFMIMPSVFQNIGLQLQSMQDSISNLEEIITANRKKDLSFMTAFQTVNNGLMAELERARHSNQEQLTSQLTSFFREAEKTYTKAISRTIVKLKKTPMNSTRFALQSFPRPPRP